VNQRQTAFTLIEILMVVMILTILGGVVIAHFGDVSEDSRDANLKANLQTIRAQLELYKMHHNDNYPTDILDQLTKRTDINGNVDENGAYGPYLLAFPPNPLIADEAQAVRAEGNPGQGWSYDSATGDVFPMKPNGEVIKTLSIRKDDGSETTSP